MYVESTVRSVNELTLSKPYRMLSRKFVRTRWGVRLIVKLVNDEEMKPFYFYLPTYMQKKLVKPNQEGGEEIEMNGGDFLIVKEIKEKNGFKIPIIDIVKCTVNCESFFY